MPLDRFVKRVGNWLSGEGPEHAVIFSSRCRLARNLKNYAFMTRLNEKKRAQAEREIATAIGEVSQELTLGAEYFALASLSDLDRAFLVERHLISKELRETEGSRGVAIDQQETLSIMVLEEDHLRIQGLFPGYQPKTAYEFVQRIDDALERKLPFAFSPKFGYLTSCPTNIGTGLRVSVMLHLPALAITKQIEMVLNTVTKINLAMRGFYGEGTQATGDFFQISNQITLGISERGILQNLESVIPKIVEYERKAREAILEKNAALLEDKICRSHGILKNARLIASEEAMQHLSAVRMGIDLGIVRGLDLKAVNRLIVFTLPAHLQKLKGRQMKGEERDFERAAYIRAALGGDQGR